MVRYGSMDWYDTLDDNFFIHLISAIHHADLENIRKLKKVFPHICLAKDQDSFSVSPVTDYPITVNVPVIPENRNTGETSVHGSFSRYLKFSGSFVTGMANAILYADEHNRRLIATQYPHMVLAYHMPLWDISPPGFESSTYNSPLKTLEKTLDSH